MAKIRVAQIGDLSLDNGVITIGKTTTGSANTITPLTTVAPLTEAGTNKFVSGFTVTGNTIIPTFTEVDLSAYSTTEQMNSAISAATADMATQEWVGTQLASYSTTEQMNSAISAATAGMATQGWVNTTLEDYVLKSSINATDTLATTSTTTIPSEKTVAAYVAAELAKIDTQAYTAGNGIDIANHVVSAKVANGEQVLSVDDDGLKTTLGLNWNSETTEIELVGINGAVIDSIDAKNFVVDGMLSDAEVITATAEDQAADTTVVVGDKYIKLTFITKYHDENGATTDVEKVVYVAAKSLVDVYTADEVYLTVSNNKFSHKEQNVDTGLHGSKTNELNFKIPTVQVDKAGHVTSINEVAIAIPTTDTIETAGSSDLATEGAVKAYVDGQFSAQATKHVHQESDTTTIALTSTPVNTTKSNFDVYQNGIRLNESEFAVDGTTLTITPEVTHVAGDKYLVCYVAIAKA